MGKFDRIVTSDGEALAKRLADFAVWHIGVRPQQHQVARADKGSRG